MPTIAILSDIHGNLPALQSVMEDMQNFPIDQVVVAGDVVNLGPCSRQTAEIVIEKGWPAIRGNNEYFLLDYDTPRAPSEWSDPIQFAPTAWLNQQIPEEIKSKIACWPDTLNLRFKGAPPIQVFHGAPGDCWDSIYWTLTDTEIETLLTGVEADFVICGHTHLPMDRQVDHWRVFNPGSVGVPLDGIFSASYMLLEGNAQGWTPTFRRVSFDYDAVFRAFEDSGYNRWCRPIGRLVLEIFKQARPTFGFLRWREKIKANAPITDELLDEFLSTCKWHDFAHPAYRLNMK